MRRGAGWSPCHVSLNEKGCWNFHGRKIPPGRGAPGEQDGRAAHRTAADQHGGPHDDLHAGPGLLQCGGQRVRGTDQRGCPECRVPGLPPAEPDDRLRRRHRCGHQRSPLPVPGREESGHGRPGCQHGHLSGPVQFRAIRPDRHLLLPDLL